MAYDARVGLALPRIDPKNYILSGMERGAALKSKRMEQEASEETQQRQAALRELAPAIMQGEQGALQQAYQIDPTGKEFEGVLGQQEAQKASQQEFLSRSAYDILQAPPEMQAQLHDEMIAKGIQSGALPQEAAQEIGQFGADDIEEMKRLVRAGQEFKDVVPTTEQAKKSKLDERRLELDEKKFNQEVEKFEKDLEGGNLDPKETFDRETKLRNEFTKLSGEFVKQRDAFGRIEASAEDPSAAGDLALIFNYMKVLDPGSTVREGEFATAQSSGSVPDRVWSQYNKVLRGERLAPEQREDFVNRAGRLFNKAERQHGQRTDQYRSIAERAGVNPQQVLVEMGLVESEEVPSGTAPATPFAPQDIQAEIARRKAAGIM